MIELKVQNLDNVKNDHETRQTVFNTDVDGIMDENEATPLLRHFHRVSARGVNSITIAIIAGLTLLFVTALGIGIYLLVVQNHSENVLPPVNVEEPYVYVSRSEWDDDAKPSSEHFKAQQVVLLQTDTRQCWDLEGCLLVLKDMKAALGPNRTLPYNFLVADGIVYENIGFHTSALPELSAIVVAFIGNFYHVPPTIEQINTAKNLLRAAVKDKNLEESYTIIGKATDVLPKFLFRSFENLPQWNRKLSDDF
ncbi:hypothetical protein KGM_206026 [Danaus plexippus plexippus]|uniref:Peptidoglycan recognition protein family domain-containing protein n=2 Tax=Danaus plexippus TaxID=13037 RepID=A0A212EZC6_DANPL|nr:hypothetical protein KGM_206026 [Danaus plexippus plexippus]